MHVLVIEDDAITAMLIEDELREFGFTSVDVASTEEEAIHSVAQRCPDLVTSDGSLLSGNGASAVKRIRNLCTTPVIFVTGDAERARRNASGCAGPRKAILIGPVHRCGRSGLDRPSSMQLLKRDDRLEHRDDVKPRPLPVLGRAPYFARNAHSH